MILIFDLFETLVEDLVLDFNVGLKAFWEEHYKDKCTFEEIKAFGEEQFQHMREVHAKGLEFPFVTEEVPLYAEKFGGEVIDVSIEEEAEFLMKCNIVRAYDGLAEMLELFRRENIPMYVLSNSGFRAGALEILLDKAGLGGYFKKVWSSADFGEVKPSANFFEMAISSVLKDYPDCSRSDILFTGDTYATDVAGAHRAGLKVAWINRRGEEDVEGYATYQIKEVTELRSLCITERKENETF